MANVTKPSGLSPVRYLNGASWNGALNLYYIPSTDTNAYAMGDPVTTLTNAASAAGVSAVTLATAGTSNVLRGVLVTAGGVVDSGPFVDPANLNTIIIPATKTQNYWVGVVDDPMVIFEIQEFSGSGSTNFTAADIGKGCNLKSGTNNGFVSGWTLDDTAAASTASTRQVRLLGIKRTPAGDNAFGAFCKFLVLLNQHELKAATAGV